MWENFKNWLKQKTGTSSVIAGLIIVGAVCYEAIPSFHHLILTIVDKLPGWLEDIVTTIVALVLFFFNKNKPGTLPAPPTGPPADTAVKTK